MFDEQTMLQNALTAWDRHHRMTYSLLEQLTPEQLTVALPKPQLDTFAKHYEEMADVQQAYASAFHSGTLDFSMLSRDKPYPGTSTKDELRETMQRADAAIHAGIAACPPDRQIDIFGTPSSRADLIQTLLHHELWHHGMFSVFAYLLKFDLPADFRDFWWLLQLFGEEPVAPSTASQ